MNNPTVRKSNFELMRIFSIILILINHYVVYGLQNMTLECSKIYTIFSHFIGGFGKLGVCLFIMITGYFMINRNYISIKHVIKIVIDTWFYSWFFLILFIFVFPNYCNITPLSIFQSVLPISANPYNWFVKTYLILYLLIPFINYLFNSVSQQKIKIYLLLFGVLWYVIPTFSIKINYCFSEFTGFVYLYCIGAYVSKYGMVFFEKIRNIICIFMISMLAIIGYLTACSYLHLSNYKVWLHFSNESSIFTLLLALSIFYFFKNFNLPYNRIINYVASSVFAIYLIQADLKDELWTKIFHCCTSNNLLYLVSNISIMIITVILFSVIFDKLKNKLFMDRLNSTIANSKFVNNIDNILSNK